ncbi:S-adenosyl-L-methionine-dependent methyltransferase, partial [Lentinus tigrinus ALCF2SS1-7]
THYIPTGDEESENDGVPILGEVSPDDDEDDDDTVPIRTLDDFVFFDVKTLEYVSSEALLADQISEGIVGVGVVRPYADDDNDDDDGDDEEEGEFTTRGQRLLLSSVVECSLHSISDDEQLDRKIYIRTQYAWYILLVPAQPYARYHRSLQRHHHIADAVITQSLEDPETTVDRLLAHINCPSADALPRYMGVVTAEDLTSSPFVAYLTMVMDRISDDGSWLYQQVLRANVIQSLYPDLSPSPTPSKNLLQHSDHTVVTPRVGAIAKLMFSQDLKTVPLSPDSNPEALPPAPAHTIHHDDPISMEWVQSTDDPHVFKSILIDGTPYQSGDFVIVQVGDDSDKGRSRNAVSAEAWCPSNRLANKKWFCKINYFFEKLVKGQGMKKFFHAQWLVHGSKTLLQEVAHPRALYWLNECDDLDVECIYCHCNVTTLVPGQVEPLEDITGPENNFFLGLMLDDECHSFRQPTTIEIDEALSYCDKHRPCVPCGLSIKHDVHMMWTPLPKGGYTHLGVPYHINDFVYVHTHTAQKGGAVLLDIVQITAFLDDAEAGLRFRIRRYVRYDEVVKGSSALLPQDNRRLVQTDVFSSVKPDFVEGKAYVACLASARAREDWVQRDDHFYCDLFQLSGDCHTLGPLLPSALPLCQSCHAEALDGHLVEESLRATHHRLRGLELFAGAGGLSTGLEMSGFIETKWAVEFSPSAAKTFQQVLANHPGAVTYNQSSNCLLEHAIKVAEGRHLPPLYPTVEGCRVEELPPLPSRDEVDFIYGGPPCQSFSIMNHCRVISHNLHRSTLVCNMISYVEYYCPQYFLLENVVGIFSYHLDRQGQGKHVVKKLRMGVVKFILRALTALGYQVQFRVLQAGQYGAPQGRRRVIFLGARGDVPMPSYPVPQYAYAIPVQNLNLPNCEVLYPTFRVGHGKEGHQCAPLPAVTVDDAISDLPKFDWQNPHRTIDQSDKDKHELKKRQKQGIPAFHALHKRASSLPLIDSTYPGYNKPTDYVSPPNTRYQMWLRGEGGDKVTGHYTARFGADVVERYVNIVFVIEIDADKFTQIVDLPLELRLGTFLGNGKSKPQYQTLYGRLHGYGHFRTAMTSMLPNCKGGRVIHPNQKRVLTLREYARSQGFPDSYQFLSTSTTPSKVLEDQMRQIGNAVPVPLALALGKAVGKALIQLWEEGGDEVQG